MSDVRRVALGWALACAVASTAWIVSSATQLGATINEFYGQTECNLVVSNNAGLMPVRAGSMGRAVPGHEVFGKHQPRTHLLHVVPMGGDTWERMLRFRDALRADPAPAGAYAALKRALAARFPHDRASYTDAKGAFIAGVLDQSGPGD
mgnify:CR=1 FL=1